MSNQPEPDGRTHSPHSSNLAARLRSTNLRTLIAVACAALGAGAMYFSLLNPDRFVGPMSRGMTRFEAALALWPLGMILLVIALLVQPPGRARPYIRAAFVLTVLAAMLAKIFAFNYSFPDDLAWWDEWFPQR